MNVRQPDVPREALVSVGAPSVSREGATTRVSADVEGATVWFESADIELAPRPEAFIAAFLIPALHARRHVATGVAIDPLFYANVIQLLPVFRKMWRYRLLGPIAPLSEPGAPEPPPKTGLFFTCGIDSFHALLKSSHQVDVLVNVHGFDVTLDDTARQADIESGVRAVAKARGIAPVFMRTNLRDHPLFAATPWESTHGGALAAAGHLLDGHVGRLLIASSIPRISQGKWGSRHDIDEHWTSQTLTFLPVGDEYQRMEKTFEIAKEPLVQKHLRVCWEHLADRPNCCRCEKCLFTMTSILNVTSLDDYPLFEGGHELAARLDALTRCHWRTRGLKRLSKSENLPDDVLAAVQRLLRRSLRAKSLPGRLKRWMEGLFGGAS